MVYAANVNSSAIVAAASLIARTLYILASGKENVRDSALSAINVNASLVEELMGCLLTCDPGLSCELVKSYISPSSACPSHYVGVMVDEPSSTPYPEYINDVPRFIWNFLSDKTSISKENGGTGCQEDCKSRDKVCIKAETDGKGVCVTSTTRYFASVYLWVQLLIFNDSRLVMMLCSIYLLLCIFNSLTSNIYPPFEVWELFYSLFNLFIIISCHLSIDIDRVKKNIGNPCRYVPAYSTRLKYESGVWNVLPPNSSDELGVVDPVWTESNWNTIGIQVYTVQDAAYDRLVLFGGITITILAYVVIGITRAYITKALKRD